MASASLLFALPQLYSSGTQSTSHCRRSDSKSGCDAIHRATPLVESDRLLKLSRAEPVKAPGNPGCPDVLLDGDGIDMEPLDYPFDEFAFGVGRHQVGDLVIVQSSTHSAGSSSSWCLTGFVVQFQ